MLPVSTNQDSRLTCINSRRSDNRRLVALVETFFQTLVLCHGKNAGRVVLSFLAENDPETISGKIGVGKVVYFVKALMLGSDAEYSAPVVAQTQMGNFSLSRAILAERQFDFRIAIRTSRCSHHN